MPTMTFAATAEVVRYLGAVPDPRRLRPGDAEHRPRRRRAQARGRCARDGSRAIPAARRVVGIIPVHVGGLMLDMAAQSRRSRPSTASGSSRTPRTRFRPPGAPAAAAPWQRCGEDTSRRHAASPSTRTRRSRRARAAWRSTDDAGARRPDAADVAARPLAGRLGPLLGRRSWDYRILAPGFKYNLTDVAAAIGIHQLARAEEMRARREAIAAPLRARRFAGVEEIELPPDDPDRIHSWHLFPIRLRLDRLAIDRNAFIDELKDAGRRLLGALAAAAPAPVLRGDVRLARRGPSRPRRAVWERLVSLPIFPGMRRRRSRPSWIASRSCARATRGARRGRRRVDDG